MVSRLKSVKSIQVTTEMLTEKARLGAYRALEVLEEIAFDVSCEPNHRTAAAVKLVDSYIKFVGLVDIDSIESLPILKAISSSGKR